MLLYDIKYDAIKYDMINPINMINAVLPFATIYLFKSGFSCLIAIKTKSQNWLNVKDDMRVALSKTKP